MSTVHPRIALTRDREIDEALRRARPLLGERKPTATLARELILRGARELLSNQGTELDRWLDQRHATPAERSTEQVLAAAVKLGAPDPAKPYSTSQALEKQRGATAASKAGLRVCAPTAEQPSTEEAPAEEAASRGA